MGADGWGMETGTGAAIRAVGGAGGGTEEGGGGAELTTGCGRDELTGMDELISVAGVCGAEAGALPAPLSFCSMAERRLATLCFSGYSTTERSPSSKVSGAPAAESWWPRTATGGGPSDRRQLAPGGGGGGGGPDDDGDSTCGSVSSSVSMTVNCLKRT